MDRPKLALPNAPSSLEKFADLVRSRANDPVGSMPNLGGLEPEPV